ncbi:hypothetical protein DL764_006643 [Monosporascus ibericus]|uniref:Uncharacterized protein n=1 Tax=Monosporascus ibericus TaxID=155417 RepID=A0A4Q4T474_9PEZI|nr:hypothetical protein DL764_006643 [Monosporascus ibericus]
MKLYKPPNNQVRDRSGPRRCYAVNCAALVLSSPSADRQTDRLAPSAIPWQATSYERERPIATTTLDTDDGDHEEMPATTAAALAAERAGPPPRAADVSPLQTKVNVNVNGADAGEGEGGCIESLETLCRELKTKVDGFLARETEDPVLRSTQAQVRVGLGVVDEALRRYRCVFPPRFLVFLVWGG